MTVQELIDALGKLDPDMLVMMPGYEGGYVTVESIELFPVKLFVNKAWWYGPHAICEEKDEDCVADTTAAILAAVTSWA